MIGICDVPELANQPLGLRLKEQYEDIEVVIGNDMNLTVYGLYNEQQFEEEKNFAVVTFPENHFPGQVLLSMVGRLPGIRNLGARCPFTLWRVTGRAVAHVANDRRIAGACCTDARLHHCHYQPGGHCGDGRHDGPAMREGLFQGCRDHHIPQEHMPELMIRRDTRREYVTGLVAVTLESLTYRIQVVEKQW